MYIVYNNEISHKLQLIENKHLLHLKICLYGLIIDKVVIHFIKTMKWPDTVLLNMLGQGQGQG